MQVKSILYPIDFSDFSAAAYQYAVSLLEYYKARILALHVVELWKYPFADDAAQEADCAKCSRALNEGRVVKLQRFVKQYSADRIQPQLVIHQGNGANRVLSFSQKENIEVIVVGTHGSRIVYCTDFSNNSERARGCAILLAAEYGAELTLLHVAEKAPDLARAEGINTRRTQNSTNWFYTPNARIST